jgi:hypothetical protein
MARMSSHRLAAVVVLALVLPTGARAELDPYLPLDTESYVSVNVRQMIASPLFKKTALGPLRDALKGAQEVQDVLKDLGFDPFKHLDRVIVASPKSADKDRGLIIAHGTFDVKKFQEKAADAAQNNDDVLKIHKVPLGGRVTHEIYEVVLPDQDMSLYVALASPKTLIASPGKDYVVDALKQAQLKKAPVLKNKAFQGLIEKLDAKQSLALAVSGKALAGIDGADFLPKRTRDALAKIEAIGGGLTVSDEIKIELAVSTSDNNSAQDVRGAVDKGVKLALVSLALLGDENKGLNLLLEVMKTVKVGGRAHVVSVTARLTSDVIEDHFKKDD